MGTDLFLSTPEETIAQQRNDDVKQAAVTLPPDEAEWVPTIIDDLQMQFPELGYSSLRVNFNAKNANEGVATGDIQVDERMSIPFVVDKFKLQPFDMFLHDSELYPMTRRSLSNVLNNKAEFGELVEPGRGETSDAFLTNALPPFDGKYTFAGLGVYDGKNVVDVLEHVPDHLAQLAIKQGQHIRKLAQAKPSEEPIRKVANTRFRKKTLRVIDPDVDLNKLAVDTPGVYDVPAVGHRKLACYAFTHQLDDIGFKIVEAPMICALNGVGFSKLAEFVSYGENRGDDEMLEKLAEPEPGKTYCFVFGHNGEYACTQPYTIKAASDGLVITAGGMRIVANEALKTPVKTAECLTLPGKALIGLETERNPIIPYTITQAAKIATRDAVTLQYNAPDSTYTLRGVKHAGFDIPMQQHRMFNVLKPYYEAESLKAGLLKAARVGSVFINDNIEPEEWEAWEQAELHDEAQKKYLGDYIKTASFAWPSNVMKRACIHAGLLVDAFEKDMLAYESTLGQCFSKVAEGDSVGGHDSVDSLLSINFLNEETLYRYIDSIDTLKQARQVCLRMLLASRIGLPVPAAPLRAAAFALDEVVNNLERLRQIVGMRR